jgi:hypothetical protein
VSREVLEGAGALVRAAPATATRCSRFNRHRASIVSEALFGSGVAPLSRTSKTATTVAKPMDSLVSDLNHQVRVPILPGAPSGC